MIDHNRRKGEKREFAPHEAQRYKTRSGAERCNARLKDEFGAWHVQVRGHAKVMCHLMLGVVALCADQFTRLPSTAAGELSASHCPAITRVGCAMDDAGVAVSAAIKRMSSMRTCAGVRQASSTIARTRPGSVWAPK